MLADVAAFANEVRGRRGSFFDGAGPISVARAPGRLDVLGGSAEGGGSLALELPLAVAALAAVQLDAAPVLWICGLGLGPGGTDAELRLPLAALLPDGVPVSYAAARTVLGADPQQQWAACVAGCWLVLLREEHVLIGEGARVLVRSNLPRHMGMGCSAALEAATIVALCDALGVALSPRELALHCQTVGRLVLGASCGVTAPAAAVCGSEGRLLTLRCQPCDLLGDVPLPPTLELWGLAGVAGDAASGSDLDNLQIGAAIGHRMIAATEQGALNSAGYLANVTPGDFEQHYRKLLPERITGADFLVRYGDDPLTQVDPAHSYAVLAPSAHVVYEHFRVRTFAALLQGESRSLRLEASSFSPKPSDVGLYELLGELLYQSHGSYSACGPQWAGAEELVQLVRQAGPAAGLYGAKAASGSVVVLGAHGADAAVQVVAERYTATSGQTPIIFSGSSPGAVAHGVLRL